MSSPDGGRRAGSPSRHKAPFRGDRGYLRKSHEFRAVFACNESTRSGPYRLHVLRTGTAHNRIGFVIPKKVLPLSVDRNRARRLLREAYRAEKQHLLPGNDIVVVVSGQDLVLEHVATVTEKLHEGFEALGLLK